MLRTHPKKDLKYFSSLANNVENIFPTMFLLISNSLFLLRHFFLRCTSPNTQWHRSPPEIMDVPVARFRLKQRIWFCGIQHRTCHVECNIKQNVSTSQATCLRLLKPCQAACNLKPCVASWNPVFNAVVHRQRRRASAGRGGERWQTTFSRLN